MDVKQIAVVCHEANRAYCAQIGDHSQKSWDEAADWQRDSMIKGVEFCTKNPDFPSSANHEAWLEHKRSEGWKYGPVKDEVRKEHPCFVAYDQLPVEQRIKDGLFKAIVGALDGEAEGG